MIFIGGLENALIISVKRPPMGILYFDENGSLYLVINKEVKYTDGSIPSSKIYLKRASSNLIRKLHFDSSSKMISLRALLDSKDRFGSSNVVGNSRRPLVYL